MNLGSAWGSIEISTESAERAISSLSKTLGSMGKGLSLGVSAPLAGIGAAAIKATADFETSLNTIQVVSGATAGEMAALEQQALSLGASTVFSAGDAAGAMLELSKAGLSAEQVAGAIAGTMDLAAAGGLDLAAAAEITANAINAFGLEAGDAGSVANTFAAAANSSSAEVHDLALGFQMAGAVFSSNKQSVDDLAAALAILGNNGIKGSDAGTSLKTMMMRLAAPTDKAAAAVSELGIEVYNADGSMRGFGDIIASIEAATVGMSDAQRNAAFSTIFGADAIRAATILTSEGAAAFRDMQGAVTAQGAAAAVAQARMQGISGAIEQFKGALESALISGATPFADKLRQIILWAAAMITRFTELSPQTQQMAVVFGAVAAAAGPVLLALSAITAALGVLLSPVGLVVAAVAALGVAWGANFLGIRDKTQEAIGTVLPLLQSFAASVQQTGQQLGTFLAPAFERIRQAFQGLPEQFAGLHSRLGPLREAFAGLLAALQPLGEVLGAALAAGLDLVANGFAALVGALAPLGGEVLDQLTAGLTALTTVIAGLSQAFQGMIAGDPKAVFDGLRVSLEGVSSFISGTFQTALDTLRITVAAVGEAVAASLNDWGFEQAAATVDRVIQEITQVIDLVGRLASGEVVDIQLPDWLASLLQWKWPEIELSVPGWLSDLLEWGWPDIEIPVPGWLTDLLDWDWPRIDIGVPGWLTRLLDWSWPSLPGWIPGGNATGSNYFEGGLTKINERGVEAAVLPRGTKILTAPQTRAALAGATGQSITIHMPVTVAREEMDLYTTAYRVAEIIQRRVR